MDLETFFTINYGMYIISSYDDHKINGQIVNTVFQVSAEPPKLAICINKENLTYDYIMKSKIFTISALSTSAPMPFIGQFGFKSGRDINKFENVEHKTGKLKAPIVWDNTISYFECELENNCDIGTHNILIGKVIDAQFIRDGELMTYAYYHDVKGGRSPKSAPTFNKGNK